MICVRDGPLPPLRRGRRWPTGIDLDQTRAAEAAVDLFIPSDFDRAYTSPYRIDGATVLVFCSICRILRARAAHPGELG